MKNLLKVTFFAMLTTQIYAQDKVENVNEYIYNEAYKNIAAYNIRYTGYWFNGLHFSNQFRTNSDFFYNDFIADYKYKLKMIIDTFAVLYPNPRFHLYKIKIDGFRFIPENQELGALFCPNPRTTKDFLLALNENNGDIKFISGQFFTSYIADEFKVNTNDPASLISYLTLRTYSLGGKDIHFKKKRHKKLWYEAYSEIYHQSFKIWVDRKDPDHMESIVVVKWTKNAPVK